MGRIGRLWSYIIERPFIIFVALGIVTLLTNYTFGTHLLGWDTLAPELNPLLNLKRALSSVWQDYRGLGTYDGLAHGATLSHVLITWLLTLVMPDSIVRYLVTFSLWTLGGYFMYRLADALKLKKGISIIAGLWYMTNIGTIQQFIAPLEVFTYHHMAMPLLAYSGLLFIRAQSKRNLLFFTFSAFLTLASGFVPTLFIIQSLVIVLFWIAISIGQKNYRGLIILCAVYGAIHSAWALPFFINVPNKGPVIQQARINEFSSDELYARNMARGSALSVLKLEGYMLDTIEYDARLQQNITLMQAWRTTRESPVGQVLIYSIIALVVLGLFYSLKHKRSRPVGIALLLSFLCAGVLLANNSLLGKPLISLSRHILPFFAEAYRIPFTKCITAFVFAYTLFLAYGLTQASLLLKEKKPLFYSTFLGAMCLVVLLLFIPALGGNFVSPAVRVKLPDGYIKVMDFFADQAPDERIMTLPAHTYWNWEFRSWGYRGSGFLWYGLPQSLLLRAFDPWSKENEQFYNEAAYAIRTENVAVFESLLTRYDISHLLIDESTINVLSEKNISADRLYRFFEKIPSLIRSFEATPLVVYQKVPMSDWPNGIDKPENVLLGEGLYYQAPPELTNSVLTTDPTTIYPFPGLYSEKKNARWKSQVTDKTLTISHSFDPPLTAGYTLMLPDVDEHIRYVRFTRDTDELRLETVPPQILIDDQRLANTPVSSTFLSDLAPDSSVIVDGVLIEVGHTYALDSNDHQLQIKDAAGEVIHSESFIVPTDIHQSDLLVEKSVAKISVIVPLATSLSFDPDILRSKPDQKIASDTKSLISPCRNRVATATETKEGLGVEARCGSVDTAWYLNPLPHNQSYVAVVGLKKKSEGLPITFYVDNPFEKRAEVDVRLHDAGTHVVVIPPTQDFFEGYGLHIVNKSFNNEMNASTVERLSLHSLPYRFVTGLKLTKGSSTGGQIALVKPEKIDSWLYRTHPLIYDTDSYMTLSQSFDPGWQAFLFSHERSYQVLFPFLGKKLPHVKAQGWANAWKLPVSENLDGASIIMVFIPQYLQYLGYGVWAALAIFVIQYKKKSN